MVYDYCVLGYEVVCFGGQILTFWINLLPLTLD